jgi:hypothetical protein
MPPPLRPAASAACNDASKLCGAGGCGALFVTNKYAKAAGGRNTTCCVGLGEREGGLQSTLERRNGERANAAHSTGIL